MTPANAGMHTRENLSVLARSEKRALLWIARRLPNFINSDHLSALGLVAMAAAGLSFAAFRLGRLLASSYRSSRTGSATASTARSRG
jgi:hypothetical protein